MAITLATRTAFISDVHLGTRGCRATELLGFLGRLQAETLYLVGDIVDFESLRRCHYWPRPHARVLEKLRAIARRGTRVIMVPGNHDAEWRRIRWRCLGRSAARAAGRCVYGLTLSVDRACHAVRSAAGLLYANDGDWVDSCTALIEQPQGSLRLIEASGYGLQRDAAAIQVPLEGAPSRMKAA